VIAVGVGICGNLGSELCGNSVHYGDGFAACFELCRNFRTGFGFLDTLFMGNGIILGIMIVVSMLKRWLNVKQFTSRHTRMKSLIFYG